jgi:hypothetical protein
MNTIFSSLSMAVREADIYLGRVCYEARHDNPNDHEREKATELIPEARENLRSCLLQLIDNAKSLLRDLEPIEPPVQISEPYVEVVAGWAILKGVVDPDVEYDKYEGSL